MAEKSKTEQKADSYIAKYEKEIEKEKATLIRYSDSLTNMAGGVEEADMEIVIKCKVALERIARYEDFIHDLKLIISPGWV